MSMRFLIQFSLNQIRDAEIVSKHLPPLDVAQGRVQGVISGPLVVHDPKTGKPLFVMDLSEEAEKSVVAKKAKYVLTKENFFIADEDSETGDEGEAKKEEWPLNFFAQDWKMKPEELPGLARQYAYIFSALLFVFVSVVMPVVLLVNATVIAGIAKLFRSKRDFWEMVRLSVASVTPAVVISLVVDPICAFNGVNDQLPDTLTRLIGLAYLVFAFRSTRPDLEAEQK